MLDKEESDCYNLEHKKGKGVFVQRDTLDKGVLFSMKNTVLH